MSANSRRSPQFERRIRRHGLVLCTAGILALSVGIYDVYSEIAQIENRPNEFIFYPDIGAMFMVALVGLIYPFYLLKTHIWTKRVSSRKLWMYLVVYLALAAACMVVGRYTFESYFSASGYHKCTDHELISGKTSRRSLFDAQAWVLDVNDCIVP